MQMTAEKDIQFQIPDQFITVQRIKMHRILWGTVALLWIAASVVAIVYFATREKSSGTLAEARVVKASLSSSLSSTGEINEVSSKVELPLAALVAEDPEKLSDIEANDYEMSLPALLGEEGGTPLLWRVISVNEKYQKKTVKLTTDAADTAILTVAPVRFDIEKATEYYELAVALGSTAATNVRDYILSLILVGGLSDIDISRLPDEFWSLDTAAAVTLGTGRLAELLLAEMTYLDDLAYTVSGLTWDEGDLLMLDSSLFTVTYTEKFVSLVLSEYDVAGIHARMREGERVYAAVAVNALSGRELVAEIVKIGSGSPSSGVTYFSLMARLVFPEIDAEGKGSYLYYDDYLTDETVGYLGVDLHENVREEELLHRYSVTVTAQKTVVDDALIVPTKCIYYTDDKKPYVVAVDADGKEKRIYIKILLSTGTDAAVESLEEGALNEGDVLHYTAESTLIGSLF